MANYMINSLTMNKDNRWLQLEVCREFQRNKCSRSDTECKFAHPQPHVEITNGKVTSCFDSIKGRCNREKPPCKYFHPPQHLKEQLQVNGRNHLAIKNALMQQFGVSSVSASLPVNGANSLLLAYPATTPAEISAQQQQQLAATHGNQLYGLAASSGLGGLSAGLPASQYYMSALAASMACQQQPQHTPHTPVSSVPPGVTDPVTTLGASDLGSADGHQAVSCSSPLQQQQQQQKFIHSAIEHVDDDVNINSQAYLNNFANLIPAIQYKRAANMLGHATDKHLLASAGVPAAALASLSYYPTHPALAGALPPQQQFLLAQQQQQQQHNYLQAVAANAGLSCEYLVPPSSAAMQLGAISAPLTPCHTAQPGTGLPLPGGVTCATGAAAVQPPATTSCGATGGVTPGAESHSMLDSAAAAPSPAVAPPLPASASLYTGCPLSRPQQSLVPHQGALVVPCAGTLSPTLADLSLKVQQQQQQQRFMQQKFQLLLQQQLMSAAAATSLTPGALNSLLVPGAASSLYNPLAVCAPYTPALQLPPGGVGGVGGSTQLHNNNMLSNAAMVLAQIQQQQQLEAVNNASLVDGKPVVKRMRKM